MRMVSVEYKTKTRTFFTLDEAIHYAVVNFGLERPAIKEDWKNNLLVPKQILCSVGKEFVEIYEEADDVDCV